MQYDIDLFSVINRYGTNDQCREYLTGLRWPDGVTCLRCQSASVSRIKTRNLFECNACRYQFSATVGTIFNDSHLPLTKWFFATYIMCESRKGVSANQLKRMLRVTYKTAWYLCHRIRAAMAETCQLPLDGTIEMDETYIGGKQRNPSRGKATTNKSCVIGIRQRGGELRFFHAEDAKSGTLAKYIAENISEDVDVIVTDELPAYPRAIGNLPHAAVNHSHKEYVRYTPEDICITTNAVESAFSLLKRGIIGPWHRISAKHLQAYLDEMTWRFNNRNNPYLFRDTMLKLINSVNMEYKTLISEKAV